MTTRAQLIARMPKAEDLLAAADDLQHLVALQAGVATRAQLARCGVSNSCVEAQIAARRWRAFGRHVVVVTNAPLTQEQRAWAAVLLLEKPCALAGHSAASDAGLTGFEDEQVHIVVAHGTHVAVPSWVKVHESRRFSPSDINPVSRPPRTRAARSVVDAATWSNSPRRACAILCASVQQRVVSTTNLEEALRAAGRIRHARVLHDILGDISLGGHTLAEIEFGPLARRAGFPSPRRQVLRRQADGKARYLDIELDLPDGGLLAVEIDGGVHDQPIVGADDRYRQNEIAISGSPMLRFASLTVRLDGAKVVDQLSRFRQRHL